MENISAPYIANLYEYGSYHGIDENTLRRFLNKINLDVCSPSNTINPLEFENTFSALYENSNDEYFGLHFGSFLNLKSLGLIYQLSLEASNLKQAVFLMKEYFINTFPIIQLETEESETHFEIKLNCSLKNSELRIQLLDTIVCFLYREISQMVTAEYLPQVRVPQTYIDEFSQFLNVEIEQGGDYLILFDKSVSKIPINKKRLNELEILLPKFLQLLDENKPQYGVFSTQVRNMILNMCNPELPNFEQVAKQFPLSSRTIQRKLTAEGFSFRKITDNIKRELSIYLSKGKSMKTQDIAYILGFSEPSAYLHAVKRWKTGVGI